MIKHEPVAPVDFEAFCVMYASGKGAAEIAKQLKITRRVVYKRLSGKKVKARIAEITNQALKDMDIDTSVVVEGIADIAFGEYEDSRDRLKALELLGKHTGAFTERFEDVTDRGHDEWIKLLHVEISQDKAHDLSFLG